MQESSQCLGENNVDEYCLTLYHTIPHFDALNPLPDDKILDRAKLKQSADYNFEFHENSRQLSKRVENTVGKGEIARYEQFLLFPQCFQKACFPGASKGVIVWEWVKIYSCGKQRDKRRNCL